MTTYLTERIAIDPDICNGRPVIRGMRITVSKRCWNSFMQEQRGKNYSTNIRRWKTKILMLALSLQLK